MPTYEEARMNYRPSHTKILFIGESRPAGGKFFFSENSNLYYATKEAFEQAFNYTFSLDFFKENGCWIYDVCNEPANHLLRSSRRDLILRSAPSLRETIKTLRPKYVIAVKKGDFGRIIYPEIQNLGYIDGKTSYLLPFPLYQYKSQYINELVSILNKTIQGDRKEIL